MEIPTPLTTQPFHPSLLKLLSILQEAKTESTIVGGAIRDIILGRKVIDFDIATSAYPTKIRELFPDAHLDQGDFGNTFIILDGHRFELTTFRQESNYNDHRHPAVVRFVSTFKEDWQRRDFAINAMAFNPLSSVFYDPAGGIADLDAKLIRTIGNPIERFEEDTLRMLRAIRLSAECGLFIEQGTLAAMTPVRFALAQLSIEQIDQELSRIWKSANPDLGVFYLKKTRILNKQYPAIQHFPDSAIGTLHSLPYWRHRRDHVMAVK